jgi:hypothetical protein
VKIVEIAGILGDNDSEETMRNVLERCNKLFDKDMP